MFVIAAIVDDSCENRVDGFPVDGIYHDDPIVVGGSNGGDSMN